MATHSTPSSSFQAASWKRAQKPVPNIANRKVDMWFTLCAGQEPERWIKWEFHRTTLSAIETAAVTWHTNTHAQSSPWINPSSQSYLGHGIAMRESTPQMTRLWRQSIKVYQVSTEFCWRTTKSYFKTLCKTIMMVTGPGILRPHWELVSGRI